MATTVLSATERKLLDDIRAGARIVWTPAVRMAARYLEIEGLIRTDGRNLRATESAVPS